MSPTRWRLISMCDIFISLPRLIQNREVLSKQNDRQLASHDFSQIRYQLCDNEDLALLICDDAR